MGVWKGGVARKTRANNSDTSLPCPLLTSSQLEGRPLPRVLLLTHPAFT